MRIICLVFLCIFSLSSPVCQGRKADAAALQDDSGANPLPQAGANSSGSDFLVVVADDNVHIRSRPNLGGEIVGVLPKGAVGMALAESHLRRIDGEVHPWYKVQAAGGATGWIYGKHLSGDWMAPIDQEMYRFPVAPNPDSGEIAYSLMEFQSAGVNASPAGITLDTPLSLLEKSFGPPDFRPGAQRDSEVGWNPFAGFSRYVWVGMEVAVTPHVMKIFLGNGGIDHREDEDDPIIRIIDVTGQGIQTSLGIGLGSPKERVLALYGQPYSRQANSITYISSSPMGTAYLTFAFTPDGHVEKMSLYWGD